MSTCPRTKSRFHSLWRSRPTTSRSENSPDIIAAGALRLRARVRDRAAPTCAQFSLDSAGVGPWVNAMSKLHLGADVFESPWWKLSATPHNELVCRGRGIQVLIGHP